jgi:hypothetical protein
LAGFRSAFLNGKSGQWFGAAIDLDQEKLGAAQSSIFLRKIGLGQEKDFYLPHYQIIIF